MTPRNHPAREAAGRRVIAAGLVAVAAVTATLVVGVGLVHQPSPSDHGDRVADVQYPSTTSTTTGVALAAPVPVLEEVVSPGAGPADGVPAPGGGQTATPAVGSGGFTAAGVVNGQPIESVVADHEARITGLEEAPDPVPAAAPTPIAVPDPPRPPEPEPQPCYTPDVTGDCDDTNNPIGLG